MTRSQPRDPCLGEAHSQDAQIKGGAGPACGGQPPTALWQCDVPVVLCLIPTGAPTARLAWNGALQAFARRRLELGLMPR